MFFVNYKEGPSNIPIHIASTILKIPQQERSLKDHEIVYKFFEDNPVLAEIQRTKSLNARLQCIAHLSITEVCSTEQDSCKLIAKIRILDEIGMKQQERKKQLLASLSTREKDNKQSPKSQQAKQYINYYVVLDKQTYIDIMAASNDKEIRTKIETLKKYTILKQMTYQQLLHLSYYLEQQTLKYKDFVYKEGDNSQYVYFVEEGEFHYIKQISSHGESKPKQIKNGKPKRYALQVQNPNKVKNSKSTSFQVGIIQGGMGQTFGDEEIISDKKRQYSVRCMSTQNRLFKIRKQYYQNVIKSTKTQMNWLKNQKQHKSNMKKNLLDKILSTKSNYSKYLQVISENQKSQAEHKVSFEPQAIYLQPAKSGNLIKLKTDLSRIASYNSGNMHLSKANAHIPNKIAQTQEDEHIDNLKNSSIFKSQHSEEGNDTFQLTKPYRIDKNRQKESVNDKKIQKAVSQSIHSYQYTQSSKHQSVLPSISGKSSVNHNHDYDSLDVNKVKSWSASRPAVQLRQMRGKYTKMIDSNSLIREKQYILEHKMSKETREDIFPMDKPKRKNKLLKQMEELKHPMITKSEVREMRSAAHSKDYMKKLLVEALTKAGYNTEGKNENKEAANSVYDIKTNIRIPKKKIERQKDDNILEDNPFDEYYFRKV